MAGHQGCQRVGTHPGPAALPRPWPDRAETATTGPMEIRRAAPSDGPAFLSLVDALAEFEKLEPPDEDGRRRLLEDAFGARPRIELWVAELDGRVVAYGVLFETYSTFRALPTLYLEDLFVHPEARRRGVATAMMERFRALARERGCGRFEWIVLEWNTGAQALYRRLGAEMLDDWRVMRLDP